MKRIGGNCTALIQVKNGTGRNSVGERVNGWTNLREVVGFLDLMNGDSRYTNYNAKLQESTHVFICDWFEFNYKVQEVRLVVNGKTYDVTMIDDPMELHQHLEILLKFVG